MGSVSIWVCVIWRTASFGISMWTCLFMNSSPCAGLCAFPTWEPIPSIKRCNRIRRRSLGSWTSVIESRNEKFDQICCLFSQWFGFLIFIQHSTGNIASPITSSLLFIRTRKYRRRISSVSNICFKFKINSNDCINKQTHFDLFWFLVNFCWLNKFETNNFCLAWTWPHSEDTLYWYWYYVYDSAFRFSCLLARFWECPPNEWTSDAVIRWLRSSHRMTHRETADRPSSFAIR